MKIFKAIAIVLIGTMFFTGCSSNSEEKSVANLIEPNENTMKSILELSTMECYYNNMAKFHQDDASGFWIWKKDKDFWIEYNGIVKFGVDVSKVLFEIKENSINISIPKAEVLGCKIDETSLNENSYIVAGHSASISSEDEIYALSEAQSNMEKIASEDSMLLETARERAKILIEDYVHNITQLQDVEYKINWTYID